MAIEFTAEQERLAANLSDLYDAWVAAARVGWTGKRRWKTVNGTDYLYLIAYGSDTGRSLGRRDARTERLYDEGRSAEDTVKTTWARLLIQGRMLKASRVPTLEPFAGDALRHLDAAGLLGEHVRVIGTNALPAYEMAAGLRLDPDLHATEDLDMTWVSDAQAVPPPAELLDVLKRTDALWTVNQERTFELRNGQRSLIDVLIAPSLSASYRSHYPLVPMPTPGQDWLLLGEPCARVVIDLHGKPARIVAPDPRLFAVHKLWMAEQPHRRDDKRRKDFLQAKALLGMIQERLLEYPLDEAFEALLPAPLLEVWQERGKPLLAASSAHRHARSAPVRRA